MNDLTFNVLKIIVSVVMALIAYYVIPYIKRRIENDKYQEFLEMINIAVQAAEQSTKGKGMGKLKKDNVMIFMMSWIEKAGLHVTPEQLDQLIESAVYELNQYKV